MFCALLIVVFIAIASTREFCWTSENGTYNFTSIFCFATRSVNAINVLFDLRISEQFTYNKQELYVVL